MSDLNIQIAQDTALPIFKTTVSCGILLVFTNYATKASSIDLHKKNKILSNVLPGDDITITFRLF